MKRIKIILITIFVSILLFLVYRSINKSHKMYYTTVTPEERDIFETIFIPGNVFPAKEIEIKSQLSGILDEVIVKIGDYVEEGTPVASIKLVPGTFDIERLESNVNTAKIEYNARLTEYERAKRLYDTQTISKIEMDEYTRVYMLSRENLNSAKNHLDILKKGRVSSRKISNLVTTSTSGTVIDIPLEVGASVIERNNYNPGTTIAVVAEMNLFKFRTLIAEHYLQHVSLGDTILLVFNAYRNLMTKAIVNKISSKGNLENGIMKYMLEAEFSITENMPVLRSGYSATAEVVLNSRNEVLSVEEKYIVYRNDSAYLYVLGGSGKEKVMKKIIPGISDGKYTEIIDGASLEDRLITNYDKEE